MITEVFVIPVAVAFTISDLVSLDMMKDIINCFCFYVKWLFIFF